MAFEDVGFARFPSLAYPLLKGSQRMGCGLESLLSLHTFYYHQNRNRTVNITRTFRTGKSAFTLIELLVVVAIISILASMLLPALAKAKSKAYRTSCINHLRQLNLAWLMYAHDNNGALPENYFFLATGSINSNAWIRGSMDDNPAFGTVEPGKLDSTNTAVIRLGKLYAYNESVSIYKCPADRSTTMGTPRVRSYSINGWMGGKPLAGQDDYRVFAKEAEITDPSPARAFVFIDEHERSINDGWFAFDMKGTRGFLDAPANRHDNGYNLSFADGHAESWRLRDTRTIRWGSLPIPNNPTNPDWDKLRAVSTSLR